MALIKTLKQLFTNKTIYPVTKTKAVYDDDGNRLDLQLQKFLGESDALEVTDDLPRDADTLVGHEPSYFAKQTDLDETNNNLIYKQNTSYKAPAFFSGYGQWGDISWATPIPFSINIPTNYKIVLEYVEITGINRYTTNLETNFTIMNYNGCFCVKSTLKDCGNKRCEIGWHYEIQ